jgi:hypothetical protein
MVKNGTDGLDENHDGILKIEKAAPSFLVMISDG